MLAIFPILYITSLYLIHFMPGSLYLLMSLPNVTPTPTLLFTGNHYFILYMSLYISIHFIHYTSFSIFSIYLYTLYVQWCCTSISV